MYKFMCATVHVWWDDWRLSSCVTSQHRRVSGRAMTTLQYSLYCMAHWLLPVCHPHVVLTYCNISHFVSWYRYHSCTSQSVLESMPSGWCPSPSLPTLPPVHMYTVLLLMVFKLFLWTGESALKTPNDSIHVEACSKHLLPTVHLYLNVVQITWYIINSIINFLN